MKKNYDFIVLGLGAMGSAALSQLAKRSGKNILGIDRFSPPHKMGSTHGDTRITRQAIGEKESYTKLSLRSYELFREIEQATSRNLLTITGGLIISGASKNNSLHVPGFFENTLQAARKYDIPHSILSAQEISGRFPQFNVQDNEIGYYENNAGFLRPEECVRANLELAERFGAEIHRNEEVLSFTSNDDKSVTVKTNQDTYTAEKLIISAGAWLTQLIGDEYKKYFTVRRQVLYWFDIKGDVTPFLPENFPIFIWELPDAPQGIYGFPAIDGGAGGVKIATEQYNTTTTLDTVDRTVSDKEIREMYADYVAPYFPALSNKCIKAVTCLYTITPDANFVIDYHPENSNVLIVSPCSGHGFKHSAAIGEMAAELAADGKSTLDSSEFSLAKLMIYR